MFQILFREKAVKRLSEIHKPYCSLIMREISELEKDYFPAGKNCKRLHGKEKDVYRIRIGSYRAIYHVDFNKQNITILRIFHRSEGY